MPLLPADVPTTVAVPSSAEVTTPIATSTSESALITTTLVMPWNLPTMEVQPLHLEGCAQFLRSATSSLQRTQDALWDHQQLRTEVQALWSENASINEELRQLRGIQS